MGWASVFCVVREGSISNAIRFLDRPLTLTNDVNKREPWVGKVITGDESTHRIFAIAPTGAVTRFDLRIPNLGA